ncbi:MAG: type III-A CRISPR-associated RAMP protein Csm3 [Halanaerobiales bacterium]|nr:type III-A CRISPR-associated RAMP protein Csm3 [Halanaerobiales bacterium]
MRLKAKLFINGQIQLLTGLSIGGSKADVPIGGIENGVIKTSEGVPFIPGSSLKGKLRSILESSEIKEIKNSNEDPKICNCGKAECPICTIFGVGSRCNDIKSGSTRLFIRDAYLKKDSKKDMLDKKNEFSELEMNYTESKWENVIDRKTSKAQHPRQIERVPAGARFDLKMVYNIFSNQDVENLKYLKRTINMLVDDYLGANGSRGYGQISFEDMKVSIKTIDTYEGNNTPESLGDFNIDFEKIKNEILTKISKDNGADKNE